MKFLFALLLSITLLTNTAQASDAMELEVDHVMMPVFSNNKLLELIEQTWKDRNIGNVFTQPQNDFFKAVYLQSKSFYVEYLSTVDTQPYWSSAVFFVVPEQYWDHYENPAIRNEHFLVPYFGCGYQLVSPGYPHLNRKTGKDVPDDGLQILISAKLEKEILNIGGEKWKLPSNGKIKVHDGLAHLHDIVVVDENSKLVAPIYEANPILRDFF